MGRLILIIVILGTSVILLASCAAPSVAPEQATPTPTPKPTPTPTPTPTAATMMMIDAHSHITGPNIDVDIDMDYVFSFLDQANISKVLLFGPPAPLQNIYRKYPDRVIPFLCPFPIDSSTGKLIISDERLEWVEKQLKSGVFKGIGEILLRMPRPFKGTPGGIHHPADSPLMLKLYDLAAQYSVPVNVHVDSEYSDELERALEHNRKTIIIWAHCALDSHAELPLIRRMMDKHPNLFADLSLSNPYTLAEDPYHDVYYQENLPTNPDGSIKQEYKQLFEDYSDRLMWGLDMCISSERYEKVELTVKVTDYYRSFLYQLSPEAAENIAYKTIERILAAPAE